MANNKEGDPGKSSAYNNNQSEGSAGENQRWFKKPHGELVKEIKEAVAVARTEAEKKGLKFDPVAWAGVLLTKTVLTTGGDARRNRLDTSLAWHAITYPHIKDPQYKEGVSYFLLSETAFRGSSIVHLPPPAVKLIDTMTDALGIPHPRQQSTVDLLPTEQRKEFFRQRYTKKTARDNKI